ncbi:MAG: restriction endonuclease subunit S, partial [Candidatus Competibacteraceae bacterium]|nr:restriction endonuclease subunit S [Candidatus Competibacteraceae bacterium]
MSVAWQKVTFDEAPLAIIDGDRGKNYPKQDEFSDTGHCLFLNTGNVTKSGFEFSHCQFITEQKDGLLRKGKLSREDVIMTTRGTIGNAAYFNGNVPY